LAEFFSYRHLKFKFIYIFDPETIAATRNHRTKVENRIAYTAQKVYCKKNTHHYKITPPRILDLVLKMVKSFFQLIDKFYATKCIKLKYRGKKIYNVQQLVFTERKTRDSCS